MAKALTDQEILAKFGLENVEIEEISHEEFQDTYVGRALEIEKLNFQNNNDGSIDPLFSDSL